MYIFSSGCRITLRSSSVSVASFQFSLSVFILDPPYSVVRENWLWQINFDKPPVSKETFAVTLQLCSIVHIFSFSYPDFLVTFFCHCTGVLESLTMVLIQTHSP
ncbi:hypothetical protein GDO81_019574 [Engystomops pustulosus]|uniref:Uncharacterized protein n=1 Tax=Engystomops pustulosus TaxID=76066 RepID=A0AAV6YSK0_ENGPU|nr:hypothetical protein GDO81_019574 [Engystomops pustulosus]